MTAQTLNFAKGKAKEKIEDAIARVVDALNFELLKTTETPADMLELLKKVELIIDEKVERIIKNFRDQYCGIPCDCCRENGDCQIGVYAARRRH